MQLFIGKTEFASFRNLILLLCVLSGLCVKISAQDFKTLKPGVEYAEVTKEISGKSVNMNLLRLDLTKVRLDVHHAMDAAIGTEKTSSIAARHGAFAAINAGFFRLDNSIWAGTAAGLLIIDGEVYSNSYKPRTNLFINNTDPSRSVVTIAELERYDTFKIGDKEFRFTGTNCERGDEDLIKYSSSYHVTTLTTALGSEIVVSGDKITAINRNRGSTVIPRNGYVISASGKQQEILLQYAAIGKKITWLAGISNNTIENSFPNEEDDKARKAYMEAEDVTNGVPQLIKDSQIDITWEQEKTTKSFVETRHPRTAVAKLRSGKFLMITVDGRSEVSGGIGLQDLAEYLLSLGATDAMNLDGGGSTTMFVDGKVVNKPSDKDGERKVGDAILVTLRTKKK